MKHSIFPESYYQCNSPVSCLLTGWLDKSALLDDVEPQTASPSPIVDFVTSTFQNLELIFLNQRLKKLEIEIRNPQDPQYKILREEIHSHGSEGAENLKVNIERLNVAFADHEKRRFSERITLKVVNAFRWVFRLPLIEYFRLDPISSEIFRNEMISPALELTNDELQLTCTVPDIREDAPLLQITKEELLRVKLGLEKEIRFEIRGLSFVISYDKEQTQFKLTYIRCEAAQTSQSPSFVIEKSSSSGIQDIELQCESSQHSASSVPLESNSTYIMKFGEDHLIIRA